MTVDHVCRKAVDPLWLNSNERGRNMRRYLWPIAPVLLAAAATAQAAPVLGFNIYPAGNPNFYGVWWYAEGVFPSKYTNGPNNAPDFKQVEDSIGCVDATTGKPIDCTYTYQIVGKDRATDNRILFDSSMDTAHILGGHSHDAAHEPFYYQKPGSPIITVTGGGSHTVSTDGLTVSGDTGDLVTLTWTLPEEAGAIQVEEFIVAPKDWFCVSGCLNVNSWEYHETIFTGYSNFFQLPLNYDRSGQESYYIDRNPLVDSGHTDADAEWGTPATVNGLILVADEYELVTPWSGVLAVNDMSLPFGGVFDIHDDWNLGASPAHWDHRIGTAVDISSKDSLGVSIPCPDPSQPLYVPGPNNYLHGILFEHDKNPLPGSINFTAGVKASFVCESQSRLHMTINADDLISQLPPTPVLP